MITGALGQRFNNGACWSGVGELFGSITHLDRYKFYGRTHKLTKLGLGKRRRAIEIN